MLKIKPYIGQVVHFMPNPTDEVAKSNRNEIDYIPAIITRVWSETTVNLKIIPDHGPMQDRGSVSHISNNPAGYHFIYINQELKASELDRANLVAFGNYLLSEERQSKISAECKNVVTHADIENWKSISGII